MADGSIFRADAPIRRLDPCGAVGIPRHDSLFSRQRGRRAVAQTKETRPATHIVAPAETFSQIAHPGDG
ncbi:hypothetical protein [Streptomyces sp. KL116D]|uniref:hypothetical protein n=1 Tax=Streptomyces sp. KL116D TaxID=3045152 RepID=UPI0035577447